MYIVHTITSAFAQSVKETKRCNVENIINVSIGLHQACKCFVHDRVYRPTTNDQRMSTYIRKLGRVTRTERIIRIICRIIPGDYGGRIGWQKSCQWRNNAWIGVRACEPALCKERPTRLVEGNEEIEGNIDYARFSVSGKLDFLICTIDPRP